MDKTPPKTQEPDVPAAVIGKLGESYFPIGLPISRGAWKRYRLGEIFLQPGEGGVRSHVDACRRVADAMNRRRKAASRRGRAVHAGDLLAADFVEEALRYLAETYVRAHPDVLERGLDWAGKQGGQAAVNRAIHAFVDCFPPLKACAQPKSQDLYLDGATEGQANRHIAVKELFLLDLAAKNRAFRPFRGLFDEKELSRQTHYKRVVQYLDAFLGSQPPLPPLGLPLSEALRAPMKASPDSLAGQLDYIRRHWAGVLPEDLLRELQLAEDVIHEEHAVRLPGPGPTQVLEFGVAKGRQAGHPEPEQFSVDLDWMSNVVLMAKSVYVWLDQLSKRYERRIARLDEVPDEELERLARWGFTGLWLIGVWERSPASRQIKQHMGNAEAAASAYSLYDYVIAEDLGGEAALADLRARARRYGILLASDMVPNHMGIYSKWVIEHPDWFIQSGVPPFPVYRFTGADLSPDARVSIRIEDGYWEHRDAAVVFQRVDRENGEVRYIFHGNDGTNMPWNDTAQLNFLKPEVREAVIQTILHVARQFPIIRFDAAMTLAKRHYQRLWFPKPGEGGAIPSRAEHVMTEEAFDAAMPAEFWRDVVDRVAAEAPDTLLLAEAFWLMEGYFVRTLGMHRVYNSAFMNMLKMEENAKYRQTIKNVLEFSPEVLKRFVNFMNNPDEATAVEQFGREDKYFEVAVLLATMPGLPMFGHGQIEGLAEKYGMEYTRAYWDEAVDEGMVTRHEREIFPLIQRRRLFSGAEHFALYDFETSEGHVDENVFAYSNRCEGERALILCNNSLNTTSGVVRRSVPVNVGSAEKKDLVQRTLVEALDLNTGADVYHVFRDHRNGLEYLRRGASLAEEGLFVRLEGYAYHAFLDFREVRDEDGTWARLADTLDGGGVPDMEEARRERVVLAPVLEPFKAVMNAGLLTDLASGAKAAHAAFEDGLRRFLTAAAEFSGARADIESLVSEATGLFEAILELPGWAERAQVPKRIKEYVQSALPADAAERPALFAVPLAWSIVRGAARLTEEGDSRAQAACIADWMLDKATARAFAELGAERPSAYLDAQLVTLMAAYESLLATSAGEERAAALKALFEEPAGRAFLGVNLHEDVLWFRKEQMERLVYSLFIAELASLLADESMGRTARNEAIRTRFEAANDILSAAEAAGYRVERTLDFMG